MKQLLPLLLLVGLAQPAAAQTLLYQPRDIKAAFAKGTRSPDGRPGPNYWQNRARYDITVQAAPPARDIRGRETITYFNNSPDTLRQVVLRLIQNIHRPGVSRDGDASPDYLTTGLVIDTFQVAGQARPFQPGQGTGTIQGVRLPKALAPHDSVKFAVAWHFPISVESGREGMIDPTTYFLAYFYPRIAVYDDYASDKLLSISSKFNDLLIPLGSLESKSIGPRPGDPGADLLPAAEFEVPDPDATALLPEGGSEEVEVEETERLEVEVEAPRAAEERAAGLLGRIPPPEGELMAARGEAVRAERARTANSSKGRMREE